jgi:2-polyprenyl-6-methoxyphenol hydroxylase-like FAD-dependent oxidoreductase
MKFVVIGAGPAGLYFALLARKRFPDAAVQVYEQNPCNATYGFGIVLAESGLSRLRRADPDSYEAIMGASFISRNRIISHPDESFFVEGGGYGGAIPRLRLLEILAAACEAAKISITYNRRVEDLREFNDADLIVGADGVNSVVRTCMEREFGTTSYNLTNRVAWYGTRAHFPYPILAFKRDGTGHFVAAGYAYTEHMSTFVPECDAATWEGAGLNTMSEEDLRAHTERVFANELQGHRLISNNSSWRPLPVVRNREWSSGNCVLIGDALHSAHPTIGSGTRIAMEDSIALIDAIMRCPADIPRALTEFRRVREPQKDKLVSASEKSFRWYEEFGSKVETLSPIEFLFDFFMRTGRISYERLLAQYPIFMQKYGPRWAPDADASPAATPGRCHDLSG